ncbi:transposase family protein [Kutzneria buriramensis]|uniref:transposase family protein n=1 Tax=Kutzneria buriramensis TaxID=1045776 RepID=UPI000E263A2E
MVAAAVGDARRAHQRPPRPGPLHHRPGPKKTELRPHLKKCWTIPPKANATFAAVVEDVLTVYARPCDPASLRALSDRVHGTYSHSVVDLPVAGRGTVLVVRVRRFVCSTSECPKRTFVEHIAGGAGDRKQQWLSTQRSVDSGFRRKQNEPLPGPDSHRQATTS